MQRLDAQLSPQRVLSAMARRIANLPHTLAWAFSDQARDNRQALAAFAGLHRGQRAFIMGNGPSLGRMDLGPLADEVTFGMNRIYLLFEQMVFQPSYYVSINDLVLGQFAHEIAQLPMPNFLNWTQRHAFPEDETILYLRPRLALRDGFQGDVRQPIYSGGTVTYAALQLAYYLGFDEVILIGVDHRFAAQGTPNQAETRAGADRDHFHPDYFPAGSRWQLPDLRRSELAYQLADEGFRAAGRRVLDATVDGACPVFEKVDFEGLF